MPGDVPLVYREIVCYVVSHVNRPSEDLDHIRLMSDISTLILEGVEMAGGRTEK